MLSLADFELDLTDPGNEMARAFRGKPSSVWLFLLIRALPQAGPVS